MNKLGIFILGPTYFKWSKLRRVLVFLPSSLKRSILGDGAGLLSMPASIACPPPLHCPLTSSHIHRTYTHRRARSTHSASHSADLLTRSSVTWHVCTNEAVEPADAVLRVSPAEPSGLLRRHLGRLNPPPNTRGQLATRARPLAATDDRERHLVWRKAVMTEDGARQPGCVGCACRFVSISGGEMNSPSMFPYSYFLSLCRSR